MTILPILYKSTCTRGSRGVKGGGGGYIRHNRTDKDSGNLPMNPEKTGLIKKVVTYQ